MTREPAKARPTDVDLRIDPDTGSRQVTLYEGPDKYVMLIASRHASDSLVDTAARLAKGDDR